ncbi:MAG: sulfur transferase domain-containing protein [Alphaproteobacteria bacterium]|nr:sulfur transferase domain-containing protein [Alphaproteobacteria bacterium]MDD9920144.1 sulfur transferase domain-containing protein [Alphaproteobacteria bacterium]
MPVPSTCTGVLNYATYNDNIATGGKLLDFTLGIQTLKRHNFQAILDLRTESEGAKDEEKAMAQYGMNYVNFPVAGPPTSKQIEQFQNLLQQLPRPLLVHCATGPRATMMLDAAQAAAA